MNHSTILTTALVLGFSAQSATANPAVCDAVWRDASRDRDLPVRIRVPEGNGRVPVILFSHGLGGSVDAGTDWARAWSEGGFAVVHLQHPGSDASLMDGATSPQQRLEALKIGMDGRQLIHRTKDVSFVLDELTRRSTEGRCDLSRIDLTRVGMSGHSFGAQTTQAVSGQTYPGGVSSTEHRIDAAVAFSPAPPNAGAESAFAKVNIPFFSITGSEDEVPMLRDVTAEERTLPFQYMPPGGKYLLFFEGADHADFGGNPVRGRVRRRGNQHVSEVVKRSTLEFWRSTLLGDTKSRAWLDSGGPKTLLRAGDRYEAK